MDVIEIFPEDLQLNIFSRISLKPRTRLKCVSKRWCAVLNCLRKSFSSSTTSSLGLLLYSLPLTCNYERRTCATLLRVQDQGRKCLLQNSYQLPNIFMPRVTGSCQGLVLYYEYDERVRHGEQKLYVVNPMLQQCRLLPPLPNILPNIPHILFACIAFSSQQHFQVIVITGLHKHRTNFYIFESEKWEWKEQFADNAPLDIFQLHETEYSFFLKEKLYMICLQHIVIYNFEDGILNLVCLPVCDVYGHDSVIMWVSEERLYYCVSNDIDVIHIWGFDEVENKWRSMMNIPRADKFSNFKLLNMDLTDHKIKFMAFHDDLQILYILAANIVIAYSFETRKMTKVWGSIFPMDYALRKENKDVDFLVGVDGCPFVFNNHVIDLSIYPLVDAKQY